MSNIFLTNKKIILKAKWNLNIEIIYIYIYIEFIESKLYGELSVSADTEIWQLKKSPKNVYDKDNEL